MSMLCAEDNIAMTPYSSLANGRLSRRPRETSERLEKDSYARFKYDLTREQDGKIIQRVIEIAETHGVTMTEISYLEELYIPHSLTGIMAQNKPDLN